MEHRGILLPFLLKAPTGGRIMLAVLAILTVAVPILNLAIPVESTFHVPTYVVALLGKYLCFALLASKAKQRYLPSSATT